MRKLLPYAVFLGLSAAALSTVYVVAFRAVLDQLAHTGSIQLGQAADRLLAQIVPFRQLPNLLSRHPVVTGLIAGEVDAEAANNFLANTALTVGADAILLLDRDGRVVAASDYERATSALGETFADEPFVRRALSGALGLYHGLEPKAGARTFFVASGIFEGSAPPSGVVLVRVNAAELEFDWQGGRPVLAFLDSAGVIFVSNRVELSMTRDAAAGDVANLRRRYGDRDPVSFYDYRITQGVLGRLWVFPKGAVIPSPALALTRYMPGLDMSARIFIDTAPAAASARLFTVLAALGIALVSAALWALGQRRRRISDRLAAEEAANMRLEARVEDRTRQLRAAQDQLVQAGRLTALGQMSAGISHELNQPLAAIRNFAENGIKLIDRDRAGDVRGNLGRIVDQTDRIDRIIRNLRGFARKEKETLVPVDVVQAVDEALTLFESRARIEGVTLSRGGAQGPVMALGGPVRLQQVLVNLIGNAMDAVADGPDRRVEIDVRDGDPVRLAIRDTGQGIAEPARVFDPFYSTKDVGASKGMGLGLSISYGLIGTFGGQLSCRNTGTGAEFAMTLQRAPT